MNHKDICVCAVFAGNLF